LLYSLPLPEPKHEHCLYNKYFLRLYASNISSITAAFSVNAFAFRNRTTTRCNYTRLWLPDFKHGSV